MPIEGKCETCEGTTSDYNCLSCVMLEKEKLTREIQDLRDLCRGAFKVIRETNPPDRVGKIVVCTLSGNLWRAANAMPLTFSRCGAYLKTTTDGVSDICNLGSYHDGNCEK